MYIEANVDVTQEIEQRAQQAAQAGAEHCTLYSISCVQSSLSTVYSKTVIPIDCHIIFYDSSIVMSVVDPKTFHILRFS